MNKQISQSGKKKFKHFYYKKNIINYLVVLVSFKNVI